MKRLLSLLLLSLPLLTVAQVPAPDTATVTLAASPLAALPDSTTQLLPPTDTLTAATAAAAPDSVPAALRGLSAQERALRGRADARAHYRPRGAFWAGVGAGAVVSTVGLAAIGPAGFAGGLGTAVAIGALPPGAKRLQGSAPEPQLLRDPDYYRGYATKARGKHMGKAVLGWGVGAGVTLGTLITILIITFSGGSLAG